MLSRQPRMSQHSRLFSLKEPTSPLRPEKPPQPTKWPKHQRNHWMQKKSRFCKRKEKKTPKRKKSWQNSPKQHQNTPKTLTGAKARNVCPKIPARHFPGFSPAFPGISPAFPRHFPGISGEFVDFLVFLVRLSGFW